MLDAPADGAWNMAVDAALCAMAESDDATPVLRLYGWSRPTLSVGYAQNVETDVDPEYLHSHNIDLVRRPTGGRAVLHWDEITYSVVIPASDRHYGSLRVMYETVARALKTALRDMGLAVDEDSVKEYAKNPCCFATRTRHEISVMGRKVVGSAQRRSKKAALQHGSVILTMDTCAYLSCLRFTDPRRREEAALGLGGINSLPYIKIKADEGRNAIIRAFERVLEAGFMDSLLTPEEEELAKEMTENFMVSAMNENQPHNV